MNFSPFAKTASRAGGVAAATVALLLAGAGAANAAPTKTITSGHIDAVTVTCDWNTALGTMEYDAVTTITGNPHGADEVPSGSGIGQIGDYLFVHDESVSAPAVAWSGGEYAVLTGAGGTIADIGFSYECDDVRGASTVTIDMANVGALDVWAFTGAGSTSNTDANVITLTRTGANHHVHGNWYFEAPAHIAYDYELTFNVNVAAQVTPFNIRVQP